VRRTISELSDLACPTALLRVLGRCPTVVPTMGYGPSSRQWEATLDPTETSALRTLLGEGTAFRLRYWAMGLVWWYGWPAWLGLRRVVGSRNRGTGYGTVLTLLVRTSKDLQGRPPLVSRCIYFMGLLSRR
jgi:hypothetical protein